MLTYSHTLDGSLINFHTHFASKIATCLLVILYVVPYTPVAIGICLCTERVRASGKHIEAITFAVPTIPIRALKPSSKENCSRKTFISSYVFIANSTSIYLPSLPHRCHCHCHCHCHWCNKKIADMNLLIIMLSNKQSPRRDEVWIHKQTSINLLVIITSITTRYEPWALLAARDLTGKIKTQEGGKEKEDISQLASINLVLSRCIWPN